jgi:drug/metabolite transporter (DMT)-like permease
MAAAHHNRLIAIASILGAIALANIQDVIVKDLSSVIPAYEALIFRTIFAFPILFAWLVMRDSPGNMFAGHVRELLLRSVVLSTAYFSFILSIAALPLATAVSIYFTMPFFVAGLSGVALGERVPVSRWFTIILGFTGVLISVRPEKTPLQPAVFFGLYAALAYAIAQMWGRRLTQRVDSIVILNWQNLTNFTLAAGIGLAVATTGISGFEDKSIDFLVRPWTTPNMTEFLLLAAMGALSALAAALFLNAYRLAEANFVAPFEYSAIVWATLYGALIFNDRRDMWDWVGTAIVISAGLLMIWMERRPAPTPQPHANP